jgi:cytochrome c peroxidase
MVSAGEWLAMKDRDGGKPTMKVRVAAVTCAAVAMCAAGAATQTSEPIQPIKPAVITNPAMTELGKQLYFDPRL